MELTLRRRAELATSARDVDICDWAEANYYVVDEETRERRLIKLALHQKAVLRLMFKRVAETGRLPFTVGVVSTVKKSGKTTLAAIIARYVAETQTRAGEVYAIGNDFEQAKERAFKSAYDSIRLTPGATMRGGDWVLPDRWLLHKTKMECLSSGTVIKAIAVDAAGEAGANPDLTVWTELWGFEYPDALKFYAEMTPVPTKPDSMRLIETYAGFEGESALLYGIYKTGLKGKQLTAGELAKRVCRPEVEGEGYEDFLGAFEECRMDPDALVPIWLNEAASLCMYWDSGTEARRMPWQRGVLGEAYYREEEHNLPNNEFQRLHLNLWVGAESQFVPMAAWDSCRAQLPPLIAADGIIDKTPLVLAADAATTGDCFGIVAVSRPEEREMHETHVQVRACKKWDPADEGGRIDYSGPESFLRTIILGGCVSGHPLDPKRQSIDVRFAPLDSGGDLACPSCRQSTWMAAHNVVQLAYDPFQLEDMMGRFRKEGIVWCEPFSQQQDRLTADRQLYDLIMQRRLMHDGNLELREHIANANAKLQKEEDSKLRIIKKATGAKIDLTVALSMACHRCLYLRL